MVQPSGCGLEAGLASGERKAEAGVVVTLQEQWEEVSSAERLLHFGGCSLGGRLYLHKARL